MTTQGVIYSITHRASGRRYIGSTVLKPLQRYQLHVGLLNKGRHTNRYLQAAWTKYGEAAFEFAIIEEVQCAADLTAREQAVLDAHRPHVYNVGFTVDRAALGLRRSAETRAKIGAAHRGMKRPAHVGQRTRMMNQVREISDAQLAALKRHREAPKTAAHRASISAAHMGHMMSAETKAKISATKRAAFARGR